MKGRLHLYEGYTADDVVLPLRVMRRLGADKLILTNAVGGLNPDYKVGDFMLVKDHISSFVTNPLIGGNDDSISTRFPSMTDCYDTGMMEAVRDSAAEQNISLREGVLVQLTGPSYETEAECRMLRSMGGDAVGMSTVIEAIAGHHAGMKVCTISSITNMSANVGTEEATEEEVIKAGENASENFKNLLTGAISKME
jgi:purine-nucleoside phosphorylase